MSTDLGTKERLANAQRELHSISEDLFHAKTSKKATRHEQGRRLNAVAASLRSVELLIDELRRS